MALVIKNNGEAVVEEPKTTAAANTVQPTAADAGSAEKVEVSKPSTSTGSGISGTSVPENVTSGMSFNEVKAGLNQAYDSKWDEEIADLYNKIVQRQPYNYSSEDDMLFQKYQERYMQQGKQAMRDTIGQAAALTGGYGNSYAQRVGQETYDEYLTGLSDKQLELAQLDYQRYLDEGNRLTQLYGLLGDMDEREMNQFKLNQTVNQGAYERFMNEAALRGAAGDFGGYEDIFGKDSAGKMQQTYNLDRLLPLYEAGLISADQLNQLLGPMLSEMGIVTPAAVAGVSGGGDPWDYGGVGWNPGYMSGPSGAGSYTLSDLLEGSASGYTGAQISSTLSNMGVDTSSPAVQQDIKWALSK